MIKTVLFDLDGTLLPMEMDVFVNRYFTALAHTMQPRGYNPKELIDAVWAGTAAMVQNDGSCTNEERFWQYFADRFGKDALRDIPHFEAFYREVFPTLSDSCGHNPDAKRVVRKLKAAGYTVVLATNPIFPAIATEARIRWTGLEPEDFIFYTTYENCRFSKPNPAYYDALLKELHLPAEECLMVGNDADEDLAALQCGISVFMLTDCLINKHGTDLSGCPQGGFRDLEAYLGI